MTLPSFSSLSLFYTTPTSIRYVRCPAIPSMQFFAAGTDDKDEDETRTNFFVRVFFEGIKVRTEQESHKKRKSVMAAAVAAVVLDLLLLLFLS